VTRARTLPTTSTTYDVSRARRGGRIVLADEPPTPPPAPVRRPAKLAHLLAMAHHLEALIQKGSVAGRADIARRLGVTRARVTQILDLTLLAPDIQEEILFAEAVDGVEPRTEREARRVARELDWQRQRALWRSLVHRQPAGTSRPHAAASAFAGAPVP
jgi:hypothetical protein